MPYSINKYSTAPIAVVEDGTIDNTLDIKLIGKNYAGYGEVQNENFVFLLENFAGANEPPRAISGQLWYDSSVKKIKVYDSNTARWRSTAISQVGTEAPAGLAKGDFWYDELNKQVSVYDGSNFILVGPQGVAGLGTTQMKSVSVKDDAGADRAIIQAIVDGEVMFVVNSSEAFLLNVTEPMAIAGWGRIKRGITLVNTNNDNGVTDSGSGTTIWGTSSNALRLADHGIGDFVLQTGGAVNFDSVVHFADVGYTVGAGDGTKFDVEMSIDTDGITPIIKTNINNTLKFQMYNASTPLVPDVPLTLVGANILPGSNNTADIGSTALKYKNIYGATFSGVSAQATRLKIDNSATDTDATFRSAKTTATSNTIAARDGDGAISATAFLGNATSATSATTATNSHALEVDNSGVYRTATVDTATTGTANSIACRDFDGNLNAVLFQGTATSAFFADLAEKYLADDEYEIGTVVVVGGEKEVTACSLGERAFGAVSGSPAYMMNSGLEGGTYIALKGRVPVKVVGAVRKGDKLIAAANGCAGTAASLLHNTAVRAGSFPDTFAIALENSDESGVKLVECIIL